MNKKLIEFELIEAGADRVLFREDDHGAVTGVGVIKGAKRCAMIPQNDDAETIATLSRWMNEH